ncbi:MAG: RNA pseudouridine synthase, partial [Chloroflexota bacterium]|nr:RNA pseudouridine synthase [Chloroflexota bacterium]
RRSLVSQIQRHTLRKRYLALTVWPPALADGAPEGEVDAPLARDTLDRRLVVVAPDGQPARTRWRRLAAAAGYALVLAEPVTGRTHQIRAHLATLGAPLLGDAAYLPAESPARELAPRVMLHAWRIDLTHPASNVAWSVTAPPPVDFAAVAEALGLGAALAEALAEQPR